MPSNKPPFRVRLAARLLGRDKAFIPHLSNTLDFYDLGGNRIKDYKSKGEAITANVGWAFAANDAIARPMARVRLVLYKVDGKGNRIELPETHDVMKLLRKPNAATKGKQLRRLHVGYMNFTGESYMLMMKGDKYFTPKAGQLPDSLHILPAHLVEFDLGDNGYSGSKVKFNGNDYSIENVIRDIDPDPRNPYFGQSRITAAAAVIDTDDQMKDWNRRFFANNARPGLIFSTNEEMTDEAYARWKEQFSDEHTGTANAYKNLLVENGDAKPYMMSQQDLDFLASRKFSMQEILAMFNVSPAVLGLIEDANKSIMDGAFRTHLINNVIPRVEDFCELMNTSFIQTYDPTLELGFENPVGEDKAAKLTEMKAATNTWMTIDEVREEYGLKELPEGLGKQLYVQGSLKPLDVIADATTSQDTSQTSGDGTTVDDTATNEGKKSVPKPKAA